MKLKTQKEAWKKMTQIEVWESFTCPGRPSRDDIKNFNALISESLKGKMKPHILVLGCTPEVRDMLYKFSVIEGARITCVDISKETYIAMSQLTKIDNKSNEKFVLSNWADMEMGQKFDVIIGDYVVCNMDISVRDKIFENISRHLKSDGIFIERDFVTSRNYKIKTIAELFEEYVRKLKKEEITYKEATNWMANDLLINSWTKHEGYIVSISCWEKELIELRKSMGDPAGKDQEFKKDFFERLLNIFALYKGKYWTAPPKGENLKMLKKHFKVNKCVYSKDYSQFIASHSPIYSLSRK